MNEGSARIYKHLSLFLFVALCVLLVYIAYDAGNSNTLLFGDDSGELSSNDACNDIRFRGPGMGLISADTGMLADATDCRALFQEGRVYLSSEEANLQVSSIVFGEDDGNWTFDDECDDPRFEGDAVAFGADRDEVMHDATDCRTLLYRGQVSYAGEIENIVVDGIVFGDNLSTWANDDECDDPRFEGDGMADALMESDSTHDASDCLALYTSGAITFVGEFMERADFVYTGRLDPGDAMLEDSKYFDTYSFEGQIGQNVILDLRSEDFDTYLYVISPDGEEFSNDDFEGDTRRSVLNLNLNEDGVYEVRVSSFSSGASGAYTLGLELEEVTPMEISLDVSDMLEMGDEVLGNGKFVDRYEVPAIPGQILRITLVSDDFDAYVTVNSPGGQVFTDDDGFNGTNSLLELEAPEPGIYEILASSYSAEETGSYRLRVAQSLVELPINQ